MGHPEVSSRNLALSLQGYFVSSSGSYENNVDNETNNRGNSSTCLFRNMTIGFYMSRSNIHVIYVGADPLCSTYASLSGVMVFAIARPQEKFLRLIVPPSNHFLYD